ncbi:MAG: aminotransferase class I/II-fold pyridoxal phosphate-dependent enzyme [Paenacidovorax caeni]
MPATPSGWAARWTPANVIVTSGCMDSVALCLRAVTQPGDVVALESPTHFSFLEVLQSLHLRALEIPTHPRHGLSLDALQLALDTQPVKALLVVPTRATRWAPACRCPSADAWRRWRSATAWQ